MTNAKQVLIQCAASPLYNMKFIIEKKKEKKKEL